MATQPFNTNILEGLRPDSPRFGYLRPTNSVVQGEDYDTYNSINGSYDRHFPLFAVNNVPLPKLKITTFLTEVNVTGALAPFRASQIDDLEIGPRETRAESIAGKTGLANPYRNENKVPPTHQRQTSLQYKWSWLLLDPRFTNIQDNGLVSRIGGGEFFHNKYYASNTTFSPRTTTFLDPAPPGFIINYTFPNINKAPNAWPTAKYKCLKTTNRLPTNPDGDNNWVKLEYDPLNMTQYNTPFSADVYRVEPSTGSSIFVETYYELNRTFKSTSSYNTTTGEHTLSDIGNVNDYGNPGKIVHWNMSYWHVS